MLDKRRGQKSSKRLFSNWLDEPKEAQLWAMIDSINLATSMNRLNTSRNNRYNDANDFTDSAASRGRVNGQFRNGVVAQNTPGNS